jgi:signal transduction histidine kinase
LSLPIGSGGAGRALAERQAVTLPDAAALSAYSAQHPDLLPEQERAMIERLVNYQYLALLSVPLIVMDEDYGAITLYYRQPRQFSEEDQRLAMSVADQVALAIESARLREQAEQAAALAERSRLARELHDSVTQSLYSVTLYAEAAARLLDEGNRQTAADYLRELRDTGQEALREMRLLIFELHRPALGEGGLAAALQARLDAVETRGGMHAELAVEGDEQISRLVQAELYNIAHEALNNVLKHAHANHVRIRLRFGDNATEMEISDDGAGFESTVDGIRGGFGISGMKERAQKIGGTLQIESAPGKGTKVTARVPVSPAGHPNQSIGVPSGEKMEE